MKEKVTERKHILGINPNTWDTFDRAVNFISKLRFARVIFSTLLIIMAGAGCTIIENNTSVAKTAPLPANPAFTNTPFSVKVTPSQTVVAEKTLLPTKMTIAPTPFSVEVTPTLQTVVTTETPVKVETINGIDNVTLEDGTTFKLCRDWARWAECEVPIDVFNSNEFNEVYKEIGEAFPDTAYNTGHILEIDGGGDIAHLTWAGNRPKM